MVPVQQLNDLLAHPVQVGTEPHQHLRGHAFAFADQPEQDVLGADVVVAKLQRLAQGELKYLLGARGEGYVARRRLLPLSDDLLNLLAHRFQADAQRFERLGRDALALVNQSEQDVLGADVVVVQHPGLFLSQHHNSSSPVGKSLEHYRRSLTKAVGTATRWPVPSAHQPACRARLPLRCSPQASPFAYPNGPPRSSRAFPTNGAFIHIQPAVREQCSQVRRERTHTADGTDWNLPLWCAVGQFVRWPLGPRRARRQAPESPES